MWYVGGCTRCVKPIDAKPQKIHQAAFDSLVKSISIYELNFCISPCTLPTWQYVFSATVKLLMGLL